MNKFVSSSKQTRWTHEHGFDYVVTCREQEGSTCTKSVNIDKFDTRCNGSHYLVLGKSYLFNGDTLDYVEDVLSTSEIRERVTKVLSQLTDVRFFTIGDYDHFIAVSDKRPAPLDLSGSAEYLLEVFGTTDEMGFFKPGDIGDEDLLHNFFLYETYFEELEEWINAE